MPNPFIGMLPVAFGIFFILFGIFGLLFLPKGGSRFISFAQLIFGGWAQMLPGPFISYISAIVLMTIMISSLLPQSVIPFHYPLWSVGMTISIWVVIFFSLVKSRGGQFEKEYLPDATLSAMWAWVSSTIESASRGARAITLGARISINVMVGSIMHSVISTSASLWGPLLFLSMESVVVIAQSYVFILLLSSYSSEVS